MANRTAYYGLDQISAKMRDAVAKGSAMDIGFKFTPMTARAESYLKRYKQIAPEGHDWRVATK